MQAVETLSMDKHLVGYDVDYFYSKCHNHDFYEFTLIICGKAIHHVNDSVQVLSAGNLLFVRPDDIHHILPYNSGTEKYEFYNIKAFREEVRQEYAQSSLLEKIIEMPELPPMIMLSSTQASFLKEKIKRLKEMPFSNEREYLFQSILKDVCFLILDNSENTVDKTPSWMKELLLEINPGNLAELDYPKLLKMSGVSKSYLSKSFKKYLNMSPTEYINSLKMEYAYELISTTDYPLLDICMMVGFNSYSYFFRLFSKKYKISPNNIRQS